MKKLDKFILDACCGPKYMWYNKNHPNTIYIDIRKEEKGFVMARQNVKITPDMIMDFRDLKFPDKTFKLIVWDPPHMLGKNYDCDLRKKYGFLFAETWPRDFKKGFNELWRCLDDYGVLIFKFNDISIPFQKVLKLFHTPPLFANTMGNKKNFSKWFCFMKIPK